MADYVSFHGMWEMIEIWVKNVMKNSKTMEQYSYPSWDPKNQKFDKIQ